MVISSPCLTDIKNWLVQKQTDFGKDFSNPFTADSLLKTIWFLTHHASHAPCYRTEALAIPEQTATSKEISNPFMTGEDCWVLEDFTTYCCWFNIGAASEDLVLLRKIEENRLMFNQCFIIVALDLSKVTNPLQAKGSRSIQKMTEQDSPPPTITAMKIPIIKKGEYDIWSMRMRQYICHTDHNLWDIIVDGDLQEEAAPAGEQSGPPAPKTAKQLTAKRNQERVKSILLLAIPDEYLLKFHNVPDAKSLWAAIKSRFGGNDESKKMQRNVLKHQFENFTTAPNESLDKAYDRFQKLISQLEVHAAPVSKEDINQKFLRSLPPSWSQIALIMRNKPDIDQTDIDDLYNNLRVYEDEMKRSLSSTSNSQNLAFLSSENTSSTNEVSTASGDFGVSAAGVTSSSSLVSSTSCADEVAMLTVRVKKFIQKIGRNLDFKGKQHVGFDKSIIECYNCHRTWKLTKPKELTYIAGKTNEVNIEKPKSVHESVVSKPKINRDKVIIEDWNSDDEDDVLLKEGIGFKKIKACFVCKSSDHLTKDCDFYAKRVHNLRPNGKRAIHTVSIARPISTDMPISIARPVSTARKFAPKIAQTGSAIRPIYPRMDNGNPKSILQDHAVWELWLL
ncbi:hypothetical protein Tco_1266317 [Tanacetum coccineum]